MIDSMQAWSLQRDGKLLNLVDPSIAEGCSPDEALRCIHIGLLSVQNNPNARPLMSWVVANLGNKAIKLPQSKEPIYFGRRNYGSDGLGESPVKNMSLEILKGR